MHQNSAHYAALLHLVPGNVVFDVGANDGHISRILAGVARQIYAFEPNPNLRYHYDGMPPNVTLIPRALSDRVGQAEFFVDMRENLTSVGSSLIPLAGMEGKTKSMSVTTTTIDQFCDEVGALPDLIKIDVEGCEPEVVAGAHRVIETRCPIIIFELWESHWRRYQPMITFLSSHYHLVKLSSGSEATSYYAENEGADVDDILCLPLARRRAQ